MVDPDILQRKVAQIIHHTQRLDRRKNLSPAELAANEDLWNMILMDLQQAIQGCIDLAVHICVDERLGAPASPAEAFATLVASRGLDNTLGIKLSGAAALSNLIVHRYGDLSPNDIVTVIRTELGHLEAFAAWSQAAPS